MSKENERSLSISYERLFRLLPERYILFKANDPQFTFIDASDSHLAMTMNRREDVIGRGFFEVFPDTSEKFKKTGVSEIAELFRKVIKTGKSVKLEAFRYDIPDTKGNFVTRYWEPIHYPVFDSAGKVEAILQISRDVTSEVESARRVRDTQIQLEQALSVSHIGIWSWDLKADKIIADKNLANMFGIPVKKAASGLALEAFMAAIHPDDRERVRTEIDEVLKTRGTFESEYRTLGAKNEVRWVLVRGRVESNAHGEPISFPGVIVDITDRKATEQKLEESVRNFQDLADSMPQLIWVTRPDGYHEYYNERWYKYTGTTYEDTKGEGWNDMFHPEDRERAWKLWRHSLKTGEPYEIEYRLRNAKTGYYRWFVGRARPVRNAQGEIVKWYGTCTDIDDQKRTADVQSFLSEATKVLAASLDYKQGLKQIAQMIVPEIADWCHIMLKEGDHQQSLALLHKDSGKVALAKKFQSMRSKAQGSTLDRIRKTGKAELVPQIAPEMIETSDLSKEERDIILSLGLHSSMTIPLRNGSEVVGIIILVQSDNKRNFTQDDLTLMSELADRASLAITNASLYQQSQEELLYRQELEAQLVEANERLEERVRRRTEQLQATNESLERSNKELQDFAYVASHDLQEPLRKIQAFGNLLEEEYGNKLGEGEEYVKRIRNAAARMSTLIEDLLSFSRVTTKARPFVAVDLNAVTQEVLSDLEARVSDTGAKVTVGKLPTIHADPLQMRQLIQNLLSNAIKFARVGSIPEVKVYAKAHRKGGKIDGHTLFVEDNGIGFEEKYLDRIFAVFQRLHNKDKYQGTGIGLAICRKIVERHGGIITAQSQPGSGTTFIVTLPVNSKETKRD